MEALSLPRRSRAAAVAETAAASGLGPFLLGLLVAATAFAAFSGGAIEIPAETRLQVVLAVLGIVCALGLVAGALRAGGSPLAWAGIGLLAAYGLWSALSITWSAAPDGSWIAANRAITYALVAAVALVAASSTREAPSVVVVGLTGVALAVALYALGGKVLPGLNIGPLDLDPGDRFARLRDPLDYWNALALFCVMASPLCIWLAAARSPAPVIRIGALLALALFVLTAALAYSRGAIAAYLAIVVVMVAAGPQRLPRLAVSGAAVVAVVPAMLVAFGRGDLSSSNVPFAERADDGLLLGLVLVLSLGALALLAHELIRIEPSVRWSPRRSRMVWRGVAAAAAGLLLVGVAALALSERGLTGEISHAVDELQQPGGEVSNTPERLVSSNGSSRWVWWQEALGAFDDKPLAGWGAGSFPIQHNLYRRFDAPVRSSHSLPLQFLSETGLVGAALGLGALALIGAGGVVAVRRSSGVERSARLALLATAAAWAVHSLYDWDWEIPAVTLPALIAACVAAAPLPGPGERRPPLKGGRAAVAAIAATLSGLALVASAALPALSEGDRLQALTGAPSRAAERAELARQLNPVSIEPLLTQASIAEGDGRPLDAAAFLADAASLQPDNAQAWKRLALAYVALGERDDAVAAYRRWAETDPLLFEQIRPSVAAYLFALLHPPSRSPTAFGTPPP